MFESYSEVTVTDVLQGRVDSLRKVIGRVEEDILNFEIQISNSKAHIADMEAFARRMEEAIAILEGQEL